MWLSGAAWLVVAGAAWRAGVVAGAARWAGVVAGAAHIA
jgi:hypothetical protein